MFIYYPVWLSIPEYYYKKLLVFSVGLNAFVGKRQLYKISNYYIKADVTGATFSKTSYNKHTPFTDIP